MARWRRSTEGKIAGVSWLVSLLTVLTLLVFLFPLDRRILIESLSLRGRSLVHRLQEETARSPLLDESAWADLWRRLAAADDAVRYLVISQSDGAATICHGQSIRKGILLGPLWQPAGHAPPARIVRSDFSSEDVLHFSQPFQLRPVQRAGRTSAFPWPAITI